VDTASIHFLIFGLSAALISNFHRSPVWRSTVLMAASIVFMVVLAGKPMALIPLVLFLVLGYACLLFIYRRWSHSLTASIVVVILAYFWLKKYTILPEFTFISYPYFALGLSYIFFRVLQLLIDSAAADGAPHIIGPGSYLLYTINFTTFLSGPIQRYEEFARDQFAKEPIPLGPEVIGRQLERIVIGFFKVNVAATLLSMVHDDALAQIQQPASVSQAAVAVFLLAVAYPFFLFANFSGYIDIVIAIARLMRVRLPENFDRPFSAPSFIEFWNRWHMTLSTWLKTYVFNPLLVALMRRFPSPEIHPFLGVLCFFVTFFLIGIWHGRTSEFILYGVLLGGGVAINKLWQMGMASTLGKSGYRTIAKNPVYVAFARGLTFSWFAFALFWFWADWKQIQLVFSALGVVQWIGVWAAIWLCATAVLALWEYLRTVLLSIKVSGQPVITSSYARMTYASVLAFIALSVTLLVNRAAPVIVYTAF
jgi:alginate O-acetyltransferase complex protein AlgI